MSTKLAGLDYAIEGLVAFQLVGGLRIFNTSYKNGFITIHSMHKRERFVLRCSENPIIEATWKRVPSSGVSSRTV